MTHCQFFRAILLSSVFLGASISAAQDPVIYTDNRTGTSAEGWLELAIRFWEKTIKRSTRR